MIANLTFKTLLQIVSKCCPYQKSQDKKRCAIVLSPLLSKRMWLRCVMHNYVQMMNMGTGQITKA